MPVNFEELEDEYGFGPEDAVDEVMDEILQAPEESHSIDEKLSEMEVRMETIQYYKVLMSGGFFENPAKPEIAAKIEKEIAEFILGRLNALLGIAQDKVVHKAQFSEAEVVALKQLANPDTHQILTDVVSKVFATINQSGNKRKPKVAAKPEITKRVVEAPIVKKQDPQPTVKKPNVSAPVPVAETKPSTKLSKKEKIHVTDDGREIKMDTTRQARPQGSIQPKPFPRSKHEYEAQMEASARSASSQGLNAFDIKVNTPIL